VLRSLYLAVAVALTMPGAHAVGIIAAGGTETSVSTASNGHQNVS
jgi:hypothetical protein